MKIALISPKGPLYRHLGGIFEQSLRCAPLPLTTLTSLIPSELDAEATLLDEGIDDVDLDLTADVIGITVITGTYSLPSIARRLRVSPAPAVS